MHRPRLRRGVGAPHQCSLGSVASHLIYADVRVHIPMTHHNGTGPFNSWDRQPFIWERQPGKAPNMVPQTYTIANNFFLANYGAGQSVDNDDGSSYYDIRDNVMYAGTLYR